MMGEWLLAIAFVVFVGALGVVVIDATRHAEGKPFPGRKSTATTKPA